MTRPTGPAARLVVAALALAWAVTGCSGNTPGDTAATSPGATRTTPSAAPATPPPKPENLLCYDLDFEAALAPTSDEPPVDCQQAHTSMTYAVGTLDTVVDGHLLAVDSRHVQRQVSTECPRRLAAFLGGDQETLRLSMLRAVWFTPSVAQSDAGAAWFRCDVIAVATQGELQPLTGRLAGLLSRADARQRYAMCGKGGEPGSTGFVHVVCTRPHAWRAISTVSFRGPGYPGEQRARAAGQATCEDAARAFAADPLDFQWGYEWPTAEQWQSGQTYGWCWAPRSG